MQIGPEVNLMATLTHWAGVVVGTPARWAEINFPRVSNQHTLPTNCTLVTGLAPPAIYAVSLAMFYKHI